MMKTRRPDLAIRCLAFALALPLAGLAPAVSADDDDAPRGAAGLLTGGAEKLVPLTLSVVEPLADAPYELESGGYYSIDIVCDGSGELALSGAEFFRNIWVDEVVINDLEVRPMGMHSIEFDDEGTVTLKFIAIRPGSYTLSIPGSSGDSQRAEFVVR